MWRDFGGVLARQDFYAYCDVGENSYDIDCGVFESL
jgi:hypothetical protein